jgi:hypothetical protein
MVRSKSQQAVHMHDGPHSTVGAGWPWHVAEHTPVPQVTVVPTQESVSQLTEQGASPHVICTSPHASTPFSHTSEHE